MGVSTFTDEHSSLVAPSRIFKASIVDSHNLIPKLVPQAIKSVEFIQGNGGTGSIKQINFAEGKFSRNLLVLYQIDELNEKTLMYKYSLVEGDALIEGLEKITYEVKFEPSPDGGSISKVTTKYYTKGDFVLKEEDIKAGKERVLGMYKVVEEYLLQNPDAYV
ncbi:major allergen Pru ar 1-like [Olea europaea subsp. europaea]|uniref:Major allergen Pru ar 1-like n=1 Tax=Olea europaea subsp. europaea TaxID=158383 RepID=A0A8S0PWT9_OLEEU|nr:major allergen Pru ar 1-like [Olea europaea subsp. europaea]